ncbi:MAG: 2-dehydropantoate 2-reductase [Actinobacteria bacterium]|nr:MAG: 2-dehydropantoate 2-reductase [Actinomycetota bacterium]
MRIAVVGAGAMGSIFGAALARGGHDVVLVDVAAPLVEKINTDGVTIVRGEERTTTRIPATTAPAEAGTVDLAVFFVKCYHTASAAELARPLVGSDTVVASLQNGWGNGDVLAAAYPADQVVVGVTYNSGLIVEPGVVMHPADQPTLVGSFADGDDAGAARLADALQSGGLEATVVAPVRPEIWKKLILNAATLPTAALTGMNAGGLVAHEQMRELVAQTAREATAVATSLGYPIDVEERVGVILALLEKAGPTRASMLQDFDAGRRTEIDVINGAVVRAADEQGVAVPLNRAFVALVKGWETVRGLA